MYRRLLSRIVGVIIPGLIFTMSVDAGQLVPLDIDRLTPTLMFKITRLTGIGPDGNRSVLMDVPEGVVVPFDDFSGLSSRLIVEPQQTPMVFHTLQAELAPGVFALDQSGRQVRLAQPNAVPQRIPLFGAVLKVDDDIKMLDVRPELPRPEALRPDLRNRGYRDREYDD